MDSPETQRNSDKIELGSRRVRAVVWTRLSPDRPQCSQTCMRTRNIQCDGAEIDAPFILYQEALWALLYSTSTTRALGGRRLARQQHLAGMEGEVGQVSNHTYLNEHRYNPPHRR